MNLGGVDDGAAAGGAAGGAAGAAAGGEEADGCGAAAGFGGAAPPEPAAFMPRGRYGLNAAEEEAEDEAGLLGLCGAAVVVVVDWGPTGGDDLCWRITSAID